MIPLSIILATAILYAWIRAQHDSFLHTGKWKRWAFVEGVFVAITISGLVTLALDPRWAVWPLLTAIFAFTFWIVFDCTVGWLFSGSILYIGNEGFDLLMRMTFKYNLPIFGWKSCALIYILFKLIWLVFFTLCYLWP